MNPHISLLHGLGCPTSRPNLPRSGCALSRFAEKAFHETIFAAKAAAALITAGTIALSEELSPASAHSLDLVPVVGVAYHTATQNGFSGVGTLSPTETTNPSRFSTILLPRQSITLSSPLAGDGRNTAVHMIRVGDEMRVRQGGPFASATPDEPRRLFS